MFKLLMSNLWITLILLGTVSALVGCSIHDSCHHGEESIIFKEGSGVKGIMDVNLVQHGAFF